MRGSRVLDRTSFITNICYYLVIPGISNLLTRKLISVINKQ